MTVQISRKLFLYGDSGKDFTKTAGLFTHAAGKESARIVLLMQGEAGWQKFYQKFQQIFETHGVTNITPIFPKGTSLYLDSDSLARIDEATGIFVCGGYPYRYIKIYSENESSELIKKAYYSGIPYAGISAGAILAMRLELLKNCCLKPHFSEKNRFGELLNKLEKDKHRFALGLDSGICLQIIDESDVTVCGSGKFYLFEHIGNKEYNLKIFNPGDTFSLK
ncbi:MAG: Type 1 glutamine amidotransferase-like domain-containing protein [Candidatus Cloacimonetes bacterium]|nr:Type 1 glutamine amidotransferase-like domain-containing protein [Candidatus Cloacimonadota bacterium]